MCYQDSSIPVMRRLLNIGSAFVLVLSCWGSVFAAPCPHGCRLAAASHSRAHTQRGGAEPGGHCHPMAPEGEAQQSPESFGQELTNVATYVVSDPAGAQSEGVLGAAHSSCDQCVGRAEVPSSSFTERELSQPKKADAADAYAAVGRVIYATAGFVKEIVPYDDGPPSSPVHRHVLINVFRI